MAAVRQVVLAGGPAHDYKTTTDHPQYEGEGNTITIATPDPVMDEIMAESRHPKQPSWRHPVARFRWQPYKPAIRNPMAELHVYRRTQLMKDGHNVYWYAGSRRPAPPISDPDRVMRYLFQTLDDRMYPHGAPIAAYAQAPHFEMGPDWFSAVRRTAGIPEGGVPAWQPPARGAPDDGELFGIQVVVADEWGPPVLIQPVR